MEELRKVNPREKKKKGVRTRLFEDEATCCYCIWHICVKNYLSRLSS